MAGAENQAAQAFQVYQQLAAEEEAARQRKERERERKQSRRNYEEYLNNLISGAQEEVYQRAYRPSKPVTLSSLGLDSGGLTFDKPRQSLTSKAMYSAGRGLGRFGASDIGKKLTGSKFGKFSQNVFNKVFPRADVTKLPKPFYSGFSGGYLGRK
jgi:hypothetical protein